MEVCCIAFSVLLEVGAEAEALVVISRRALRMGKRGSSSAGRGGSATCASASQKRRAQGTSDLSFASDPLADGPGGVRLGPTCSRELFEWQEPLWQRLVSPDMPGHKERQHLEMPKHPSKHSCVSVCVL